jgi:flagellar export protein FliJ
MKTFRFPLDRALHIRRAQLEIEQAKLQRLTRGLEQLDVTATGIQTEAAATRQLIIVQPGDTSTMPDYQRGIKSRLEKLRQQKQDLLKRRQEQQRLTVEAERRVKLLEKLREQRFAEWEAAMEREQESFAGDAYLARWGASR